MSNLRSRYVWIVASPTGAFRVFSRLESVKSAIPKSYRIKMKIVEENRKVVWSQKNRKGEVKSFVATRCKIEDSSSLPLMT
jgi:hypothetical protein